MDEQTTGSHAARPRTYTDEYRRQLVHMVASTGRTAMSVAAELGIHHTLITTPTRRSMWISGTAAHADVAAQACAGAPRRPGG